MGSCKSKQDHPQVQKFIGMVKPGTVFVFSKSTCPYCDQAKEMLEKHQIKFNAIESDQGAEYTDLVKKGVERFSKIRTFPKVFVGKTCIGGCSDLESSIKSGKLFTLLDKESISYQK